MLVSASTKSVLSSWRERKRGRERERKRKKKTLIQLTEICQITCNIQIHCLETAGFRSLSGSDRTQRLRAEITRGTHTDPNPNSIPLIINPTLIPLDEWSLQSTHCGVQISYFGLKDGLADEAITLTLTPNLERAQPDKIQDSRFKIQDSRLVGPYKEPYASNVLNPRLQPDAGL